MDYFSASGSIHRPVLLSTITPLLETKHILSFVLSSYNSWHFIYRNTSFTFFKSWIQTQLPSTHTLNHLVLN